MVQTTAKFSSSTVADKLVNVCTEFDKKKSKINVLIIYNKTPQFSLYVIYLERIKKSICTISMIYTLTKCDHIKI